MLRFNFPCLNLSDLSLVHYEKFPLIWLAAMVSLVSFSKFSIEMRSDLTNIQGQLRCYLANDIQSCMTKLFKYANFCFPIGHFAQMRDEEISRGIKRTHQIFKVPVGEKII